jgi:hypothetical protein
MRASWLGYGGVMERHPVSNQRLTQIVIDANKHGPLFMYSGEQETVYRKNSNSSNVCVFSEKS